MKWIRTNEMVSFIVDGSTCKSPIVADALEQSEHDRDEEGSNTRGASTRFSPVVAPSPSEEGRFVASKQDVLQGA